MVKVRGAVRRHGQPELFDGVTTAEGNYDISNTAPVSFAWSCIGQHTDLINPARYMTFMGAIAGGGGARSRIWCRRFAAAKS